MNRMINTPPWVDSVRANFDYIADHLVTPQNEVTSSGSVSESLEPNAIYNFTGEVSALTLTFNEAAGESSHYHFSFISGTPAATLTLPDDVIMPDDFEVEAGRRYEIDILDGYGTVMSWAIS